MQNLLVSIKWQWDRAPVLHVLCVSIQAAWRMPGKYLVILRQGTHESHVQRTIRRLKAKAARRGYLLEILQTYSGALKGFLVKMSSDVLHLVTVSPVSMLLLSAWTLISSKRYSWLENQPNNQQTDKLTVVKILKLTFTSEVQTAESGVICSWDLSVCLSVFWL